MSRISGAESSVLAEHAEGMFSDYDRTFSGLSESHKTVINALCDCGWNLTKGKRWTFTSTEAADKLWFFLNSGEFRLTFNKDEIVLFFVNNNIPMYPDWKARLEAVTETKGTARATKERDNTTENRRGPKPKFLERKAMVQAATACGITSPSEIADVVSAFVDKLQEDFDDFASESKKNIRPPEVTKDNAPLTRFMIQRDIETMNSTSDLCLNWVGIERFKDYLKKQRP